MKINLIIIYTLITAFGLIACKNEEVLTASLLDNDRVGDFVAGSDNSYVQNIYNNYNCGLMYEFDPILDFAYTAENSTTAEKWGKIEFTQIKTQFLNVQGKMTADSLTKYKAYIAETMTFLDSTIFRYFETEGLIAEKLPFKILLAKNIYSVSSALVLTLVESDSRVGSIAEGSLNCLYNDHSICLNVNQDALKFNATKYKKDNFYILLSRIMNMNGLYSQIPEEFYSLSSVYYGRSIAEVYAEDNGLDLTNETEAALVPATVDKSWFYSKGFIDARYFYNSPTGLTKIDGVEKVIKSSYSFLESGSKDVRSYLNEIIHRNSTELQAFPEEIKTKLKILVESLESWGVKIRLFNPDLEVLFEN